MVSVLSSEAKKRREAAEAFDAAGRTESAAKERAEAEVLADYLPSPLSEDEVRDLVTSAIVSLGVQDEGMKAMGKVMGAISTQVKGRADGGAVAALSAASARLTSGCRDPGRCRAVVTATATATATAAVATAAVTAGGLRGAVGDVHGDGGAGARLGA